MDVRRPANDDEVRQAFALFTQSFNGRPEDMERSIERAVPDTMLVAVDDQGTVMAGSRVQPFGAFYGGRRVELGGYSPVAVAAEARGRGLASQVTAGHFEAMRERGQVLGGLYPASTALYRKAGFELGGVWSRRILRTEELQALRPAGEVQIRRGTRDDYDAIRDAYRRFATTQSAWLDRPDFWWDLRYGDKWDEQYWYVVDAAGGDGLDGYVRYRHGKPKGDLLFGYTIEVGDLVYARPEVATALWRMLGSWSTQATHVAFSGAADHYLLLLLPEQRFDVVGEIRWMLRLVDAAGAIAQRGYSDAVAFSVDLDIEDKQCDWNAGRWRLTVEGGAGRLERGGDGTISMGVNVFASVYGGYASVWQLSSLGLLRGASSRELAALEAAFSGPTPTLADFY